MRYYFAPLEGITDSVYRRLHCKYFPGIDRYYTPFFSPTVHRALTPREARELPAADALPVQVVPQLMTKVPEDFIWMSGVCKELGYRQVNLNLGCPSGTVTAKGKGSGMLRDLQALDSFLYEICAGSHLPVSIKTRLGFTSAEEFPAILEILNRYPIEELTVHPRVRAAFYNGPVDLAQFRYALQNSRAPLCYNGNLCSTEDIIAFQKDFPQVGAVMLGRGLVGNPGLLTPGGTTAPVLEAFLEELLEEYASVFGSARNAMFRLKENWRYLFCLFPPDPKLQKQLRKTTDLQQYKQITHHILHELPLQPELTADW
ncbi:MAG: tRNA-dihydrouridine synthase family protein [Oscillospiraceae bacterium]|nr:tRNA-dihydrouridine synthase family protein [Oscillospiraceae bacterium]